VFNIAQYVFSADTQIDRMRGRKEHMGMDQTPAGVHKTDGRAKDIGRLDHVSFLQVQSAAKTSRIIVVDSELCTICDHT